MAWTAIADTRFDADSVADEDLFQDIVENLEHIFDATDISDDLVTQDSIAASAVGQGELKTSTETEQVTTSLGGAISDQNFEFDSVGSYGFCPIVTWTGGTNPSGEVLWHRGSLSATSKVRVGLQNFSTASGGTTYTVYSTIRYVQASPPYPSPFGAGLYSGWYWWRMLDESGNVRRAKLAGDPPRTHVSRQWPKFHPARWALAPHPWAGREIPDGWTIELVDLRCLEEIPGRHLPHADRLAAHLASVDEFQAAGITPAEIEEAERLLRKEADDELARMDRFKTLAEATPHIFRAKRRKLNSLAAKRGYTAEQVERMTAEDDSREARALEMLTWRAGFRTKSQIQALRAWKEGIQPPELLAQAPELRQGFKAAKTSKHHPSARAFREAVTIVEPI